MVNHAREQVASHIFSCVGGHLLTRVVHGRKPNCVTPIRKEDKKVTVFQKHASVTFSPTFSKK